MGGHYDGLGSHPGEIEISLDASCCRIGERFSIKDLFLKFTLKFTFSWFLSQVIDDDDIVPGWEGKIVAWVEDDSGQKAPSYQEQMA